MRKLFDQQSVLVALGRWSQYYARQTRTDTDLRSVPKLSSQSNSFANASQSDSIGLPSQENGADNERPNFEALPSLLRRIGVQNEPNSLKPERKELLASLFEKESRTRKGIRHLYETIQSPLTDDLIITDKANQRLLQNLHIDSDYALSLTNGRQSRQIKDLVNQIRSIQKKIERLELDDDGLNDKAREKFVNRWL
jgi:hypothetical protein